MQDILTCAMGLDVHRDIIVACLVKGAVDAEPEAETRTFSTLIPEMQKLRDWVIEAECRNVAMESTGIYWQPIYEMLESCFDGEISILVVNARHMKNVPGPYNEECFEQSRLRCERKRANRLVNELQKLGYVVVAPD